MEMASVDFDGDMLQVFLSDLRHYQHPNRCGLIGDYAYDAPSGEQKAIAYAIKHLMRPSRMFLDIGANIGVWSVIAARRCKHVFAFEPSPNVYPVLCHNIGAFKNASSFRMGVSYVNAAVPFEINPDDNGLNCIVESMECSNAIKIPVRRIDDFIDALTLAEITADIVKIDTEGHEAEVIDGGRKSFSKSRALIVEHHGNERLRNMLSKDLGFDTVFQPDPGRFIAVRDTVETALID